jgi:predicted kinase
MTQAGSATLYLLGGKMGSGKTTLARKLASEHGAALICEDEWLMRMQVQINAAEDFIFYARPLRAALTSHIVQLLKLGMSVVLDVPANTVEDRRWMRALFEHAKVRHELHCIIVPDDVCISRLRIRNETKPEGIYWGHVPLDIFDPVTQPFVLPSDAEGFNVIWHR